MKKISHDELQNILNKHHKWLRGERDGERANLRYMDLSVDKLSYIDLHNADLGYADLRYTDLRRTDLSGADLSHAVLSGADLSYANLSGAILNGAILDGAYLSCANLRMANLSGANLSAANLSGVDLSYANLSDVDLSDAKLNNCVGNMREVKSMQIDTWRVVLCENKLSIGCETHSVEEWASFDDSRIARMNVGALEWWVKWRSFVLEFARLSN